MEHPEYEPQETVSFLDAVRLLAEDDGLILSRNKVQLIHDGKEVYKTPVHYEELNYLSEVYQPITPGRLITHEFHTAAVQVKHDSTSEDRARYPRLTLINDLTNDRVTKVMNVAALIRNSELPLYSVPARSLLRGEMITMGVKTLIKGMAQNIGINPIGLIIVDDGSARTVDEAGLYTQTHLPTYDFTTPITGEQNYDPRGPGAVSLLQSSVNASFRTAGLHRKTEDTAEYDEVILRVGTQPDIQTTTLALIDLVESQDMKLYYSYDEINTGEIGSVLSMVDESLYMKLDLAKERTVDMAIYNAYLAAVTRFE